MLTNHLRDAALRYADQGWPVFPCEPNGKAPLTPNGFHDATTDSATVAQWWSQWPDANIATVPGRCGCVVFDIDGVDGEAAARRLGLLAEPTLTVTTGRQLTTGSKRGRHLWFTHPGGHIGNRELVPQLEVRADNGYVMLPPSIHPNREVYQWHGKLNELKPLPPE